MEDSPSAIAPLILRNLLTSIFIHADKPLSHLVQKFQLLRILRRFLVSAFLFFLGLLPSLFPSSRPSVESHDHPLNPKKDDISSARGGSGGGFRYGGRSGVERALTQLLLIMNDIPVSSRKYEVIRSLAEKLIDENLSENNQEALKEVNCAVLAAAFGRTLSQLESAVAEQGRRSGYDGGGGGGEVMTEDRGNDYFPYTKASRLFRGVMYCGQVVWSYAKPRDELIPSRSSAEKLAAEILWLAQKMAASGCAAEAVCKWAASSNLAWLALTTEPRLQGSLLKVSAFLIKQAKELGSSEEELDPHNETRAEQQKTRQIKMKMLISWLPLLCAANNGTDAPIVNTSERAELEKIMEDIIWTLDEDHEEQEKVLSVWLHYFSYYPASDWPNLRSCYTRWFGASRTRLLQAPPAGQHLGSN